MVPTRYSISVVVLASVVCAPPSWLSAQAPPLTLPKQSPRAVVSQTVGLTTVGITYDRPAVNGRAIWGTLVPFDSVWRAGANENTVIQFTSPVRLGSREVAAGRYGLHMIPGKEAWTVILSRQANAWGSFSYDSKEDVLRIPVTATPGAMSERLTYTFDEPTDTSVVATLRWEALAVPLAIAVNTKAVVSDSLREQLRGFGRFFWQTWSDAAAWSVGNRTNLDEAATWVDRSIRMNENFTNLQVKANLLALRGDGAGAAVAIQRSLAVATEVEVNQFGYDLMGRGRRDSAIAVFRKNVADYPKSWNTYDSLGEAYAANRQTKLAIENYSRALAMVQDDAQRRRIEGILAQLR